MCYLWNKFIEFNMLFIEYYELFMEAKKNHIIFVNNLPFNLTYTTKDNLCTIFPFSEIISIT